MSHTRATSLYGNLPEAYQDIINDRGRNPDIVMEYSDLYIYDLKDRLEEAEVVRDRAIRVLAAVVKKVKSNYNLEAETEYKCNQGSLQREFDHGNWAGRTDFANELFKLLLDEEGNQ
jgi:hypothetical protein